MSRLMSALHAELELPPGVRVEFDTTPLLSEREQDERAYSDAVRATSETVQTPVNRPEHVPADSGCSMCGTCYGCDGCADPENPIDLARGDCEGCGACGPCIAECRSLRTKSEEEAPPIEEDDDFAVRVELPADVFDAIAADLDDPAQPLPPATDSPAPAEPRPRQLPCEVCGVGVLTSYVEKTGRQRHGHHPEGP